MAFKLPWSNFHELNLDWVLEKMKELSDKVDAFIGSAIPSNDPPMMDGTASAGSSVNYARGDHVHPSDTSRASQTDLDSLSDQLAYEVNQLADVINSVDDKIGFSSAAPAMNGVASPGSSDYQARADHVHPTDTSRASKDEFDTLKARVDGFSGSANPSDSTPLMDGIGSAGTGGNFSRGDHVHPSDTSKLDVSGGTITGDLGIEGNFTELKKTASVNNTAVAWRRIASVPRTPGTLVKFTIVRKGAAVPPEIHQVDMTIDNSGINFTNEMSASSSFMINKIRYTDAEYVDIHIDQNDDSDITIDLDPHTPAVPMDIEITDLAIVDAAPTGETVETEYTLHADGIYTGDINPTKVNGVSFSFDNLRASSSKTYDTSLNGRDIFIVIGYNTNYNAIYLVSTSAGGGSINVSKIPSDGGSGITVTTGTATVTFTLGGYTASIFRIKIV